MRKQFYSWFLAGLALGLLLTGCSTRGQTDAASSRPDTTPVSDTTEPSASETEPTPETFPLLETITLTESKALARNRANPYYERLLRLVSDRSEPLTWLFCGDSITANDNNYSNGFRNYSEIFESYLLHDLSRPNDRVVNTAVSGWTVSHIQYKRDIEAYSPDVVYIKIGTNDAFYSDAQTKTFKQSLTKLFQKIVDSGAIPIVAIANPFHPDWSVKAQITAFETNYTKAVTEVADELGLLLVDYFTPFAENTPDAFRLWQNGDMLHPSRLGYLKLAQTFINDIGLAVANSSILTVSCDAPLTGEILKNPQAVKLTPYCADAGSAAMKKLYKTMEEKGFLLLGGSVAAGDSTACLTRRTLPQLLGNNNLLGKQQHRYGTVAELTAHLESYDGDAVLLLMPEAIDIKGNALTDGDLSALLHAAEATGNPILLLTPPANPANEAANSGNRALAEAIRREATARSLPWIDLFAYTETEGLDTWFDENGFPDFNGCNALFKLIYRCLH